MKFKDLKLGVKLAIGFGVLIGILLIIGGVAIFNMSDTTTTSGYLAKEYIPELKVATDLRGAANRAMYEMRGYGFTEEKEYYDNALMEIGNIQVAINEGKILGEKSERLKKFGEEMRMAEQITEKYSGLVKKTVEINGTLVNDRRKMDESAVSFMKYCSDYLVAQQELMEKEIGKRRTNQERLLKLSLINEIIHAANQVRIDNFKSQAKRELEIFESALAQFPEINNLINEIRLYTKLGSNKLALDIIEKETENYRLAMDSFIASWKEREQLADERDKIGKELIKICAEATEGGLAGIQSIADQSIEELGRANKVLLYGLIVALIVGVLFAFLLTRIITIPVIKGVAFANKLSEGDLTAKIDVDQKDEVGQLTKALTKMGDKLRDIVGNIIGGADNIASASQQLSSTSLQMSQGASEQASSVEEVTSSMEQMSANIENNTDNARQTEKIAVNSAKNIEEGSNATLMAVSGMKNIADKIRIINDIAFQTNLLALNAAVEAARAGVHGKGFAVVASEVRKLAERSKVAADEIDELSKNGVEIAEKAGRKLEEIVPDIARTAQLVQEISAASSEQNAGTSQVNNAMQQLNRVTQQNAAASEEMATSSEELASQAIELKSVVSFFNIGGYMRGANFKSGKPDQNTLKEMRSEEEVRTDTQEDVSKEKENGKELNMISSDDKDFTEF